MNLEVTVLFVQVPQSEEGVRDVTKLSGKLSLGLYAMNGPIDFHSQTVPPWHYQICRYPYKLMVCPFFTGAVFQVLLPGGTQNSCVENSGHGVPKPMSAL